MANIINVDIVNNVTNTKDGYIIHTIVRVYFFKWQWLVASKTEEWTIPREA